MNYVLKHGENFEGGAKMELLQEKSSDVTTEEERETKFSVLKCNTVENIHGEVLVKIATNFYYCYEDESIVDLSRDMAIDEEIMAVAVVNRDLQLKGIVTRKYLFDILGKPYGRDVMKFKRVSKVCKTVPIYDYLRNIFSVSDELSDLLQKGKIHYFALTKNKTEYVALFSTQEMLIYLSAITQKDITLARSLQTSIVKEETLISEDDLSIMGASRMAKGVGGDFYSVKKIKNGKWSLSICDVSGKGVAASLVTTAISGMFSVFSYSKGTSSLIKRANEYLYNSFEAQKFVTGMFMEFDPSTGECVFYDMGHSYIFVFRENKLFRIKTRNDNLPLGITPDIEASPDTLILKPQDVLLLITDGISEQTNEQKEEYGEHRMRDLIRKHQNANVEDLRELKEDLFKDIYRFRGVQPQHDDMTVLFLKYHP